jgi:hypothetical protein
MLVLLFFVVPETVAKTDHEFLRAIHRRVESRLDGIGDTGAPGILGADKSAVTDRTDKVRIVAVRDPITIRVLLVHVLIIVLIHRTSVTTPYLWADALTAIPSDINRANITTRFITNLL